MPLFQVLCGCHVDADKGIHRHGSTMEMTEEEYSKWGPKDFKRLETEAPKAEPEAEAKEPKPWSPKDPVEKKKNGKRR